LCCGEEVNLICALADLVFKVVEMRPRALDWRVILVGFQLGSAVLGATVCSLVLSRADKVKGTLSEADLIELTVNT